MKGDDIAARLVSLAVAVVKLVDAMPDTPAAGQLLRSGTSPGAGAAEGAVMPHPSMPSFPFPVFCFLFLILFLIGAAHD